MIFIQPIRIGMAALVVIAASLSATAQNPSRKPSPDPVYSPLLDAPQLTVTNGLTAQQLIQDIFIGGDCFDVSNITFSGDATQVAKFTKGMAAVGLDEGIVLCTGTANQILGPNNGSSNGSTISWNQVTDSDLTKMTGQSSAVIQDRVVIEFDFRPTKNQIQFEYVFASEEYCEYVGSDYNDVFGFFISGPGVTGGFSNNSANIARVPNSSSYITINDVNHQSNSAYYINNIPSGQVPFDLNCLGVTGTSGIRTQELQFDGLTTVLTATANVQPCETYHIRLKIADIGDGLYNSAVFLKANSFNAGGNADLSLDVPLVTTPGMVYEGCQNPSLVFTRLGNNLGSPQTVNFTIDPASTAKNGVDFNTIPTQIVIPAGQTQVALPIQIINDGIAEGNETLILNLDNFCKCSKSTVTLTIADPQPLVVNVPDANLCQSQQTTLTPQITGGLGNLIYNWSNGSTTSNLSVNPSVPTTYTLTVTDACGISGSDSATVSVVGTPSASLAGSFTTCNGQSVELPISLSGGGPTWQITYNFSGTPTTVTASQNPFLLPVSQLGTYTLTAVSSNGCTGSATGSATVAQGGFQLNGSKTDITCFGKNDGKISLATSGGVAPFQFSWSNSSQTTPNLTGLAAGNYTATATDAKGCTEEKSLQIIEPQLITLAATSIIGTNCTNPQGGSINLSATGGTGVFSYKWSMANQTNEDPTNLAAGSYSVTATDANQCTAQLAVEVPSDFTPPQVSIAPPPTVTCFVPNPILDGSQSSSGPNFSTKWTTQNGHFLSGQTSLNPSIDAAGLYFLEIKNEQNGCTATASTTVLADNEPPRAKAGLDAELTCFVEKTTLDGSESSVGGEFSYVWMTTDGHILGSNLTSKIEADAPGLYQILVTNNSNGCTATDEVEIFDNTQPPTNAELSVLRKKCAATASLTVGNITGGAGPFRFILDGDSSGGNQKMDGLLAGNHVLEVIGSNGCKLVEPFEVPFFVLPTLEIDPSEIKIQLGDSLELHGLTNLNLNGISNLNWSPAEPIRCDSCLETWVQPFKNTDFTLILTDSAGCTAQAKARILVDERFDVFIPNVFSPNDDGENDRLTIYAKPSVVPKIELFEIFDRWGNLVFENKNFPPNEESDGWDGQLRGKNLEPSVFVWFVRLSLLDGRKVEFKGDVSLIR